MSRIQPPSAEQLRTRLSAWTRYVYRKNRYDSVAAMARDMPHNQGSLNDIINGKGTTGLEFAVKLAIVGQESLDTLCLRDPPPDFFRPGPPPPQPPATATVHEPTAPYRARKGSKSK